MTVTQGGYAYWSQVSPQYEALADAMLGKNTLSLIREKLSAEGRLGKVAEFGCGTGFMTKVLAGKADSLIATDLSDDMVRLAKENVTGFTNVQFQVADCQSTTFLDREFDTAIMSLVLHHVENPDKTLSEMKRILKPGGTLIIANLTTGLNLAYFLIFVIRAYYSGFRISHTIMPIPKLLSQPVLRDKLESTGFKVVLVERMKDTSRVANPPVDYVKAVKVR